MKSYQAKLCIAILISAFFGLGINNANAISFDVEVSRYLNIDRRLEMADVTGNINTRWFARNRLIPVIHTPDTVIGRMFNGIPQEIYGHTSIVYSLTAPDTVNIPPNSVHVTSWWGRDRNAQTQVCHVFEHGDCACRRNQNWNLCVPATLAVLSSQIEIAVAARQTVIRNLEDQNFVVTENALPADALNPIISNEDMVPSRSVLSVTDVCISIDQRIPLRISVSASGKVNSSGWNDEGALLPRSYAEPPQDGIQDFDFVADAPTGNVLQVISPITGIGSTERLTWIKGGRVHTATNSITALLTNSPCTNPTVQPPQPTN
jgi:hypothetical protein